jgi:hypothetical protein
MGVREKKKRNYERKKGNVERFVRQRFSRAKRARQIRKQVGRLRPDQAAPRWLSLCSPRPGKKRIEASSHARADEIRRVIILERLNHSRQRQSDPINNKAFASTEASKARDRVDFGLTHRKELFLFSFALREGGELSPPHFLRMTKSWGPSCEKQLPGERPRETAETRHKNPLPSRYVRRKGAASLSGAEEQAARAISAYAQCAYLLSL